MEFWQLIVNGLIAGSIYALIALGYTMVYGVLKFINFAHGEIFMIGAYFGYLFYNRLQMSFPIAFLLAVLLTAAVGVIIEKVAYRPLRKSSRLTALITAIGVSIFLQNLISLIFGNYPRTMRSGLIKEGITLAGVIITPVQLIILITSILLMILLQVWINVTKMGKAIRATADNLEIASVIGIDVNRTISTTFAVGSGLGAVAGILVSLMQDIEPTMGVLSGVKAFTAAVVGGIGNIPGAMFGGYLIGLTENLAIWKISSQYKDLVSFVILIILLFFRPTGILGEKFQAES